MAQSSGLSKKYQRDRRSLPPNLYNRGRGDDVNPNITVFNGAYFCTNF
ncbi:hypothetical protein Hdeb2414_s0002g00067891 [Helianthus debilis subsp. tardiflorus]